LEEEFQKSYSNILSKLLPGEVGTIAINLRIKRIENTITIAAIEYTVTPKAPKRKMSCIAEISDGSLLKVDPPKPDNVRQLKLVEDMGGK
jgi:hypothetical protein